MKLKLVFALVFIPAVFCTAKPAQLSRLTVMSYNIRVGNANDGTNSWSLRYPATAMMIEDQKPDVAGIQEGLALQLLFITENCRDYKSLSAGRDDGKQKGEHAAILYNKKTVSVVKWGKFWLSETPDKPSTGWDAAYSRIAVWAVLKSKVSGQKFMFVSTHLDNEGETARREGAALILSMIRDLNKDNLPVVLAGDFNSAADDPAMAGISGTMKNARQIAADTDSMGTYHGWGKTSAVIDHIFYSGFRSCTEFETVTKPYADRKYISDHYPVKAVLVF